MSASQARCPFCQRGAIEPQLIFESAAFLVAADLHPLTEGHLLLFPREHVPCFGALPVRLEPEFTWLKDQLESFLSSRYGAPSFLEHGVAGQTVPHAHLHAVPSLPDLIPIIGVGRFAQSATLPHEVRAWFEARGPYLYHQRAGKCLLFEPGQVPAGYLETVAADMLPRREQSLDGRVLADRVRVQWQKHLLVSPSSRSIQSPAS